jgi:hypothetical protein
MISKFASSVGVIYLELHFNNAILLFPNLLHASKFNSISFILAIPVEMITGFQIEAMYSAKGISVVSNEEFF